MMRRVYLCALVAAAACSLAGCGASSVGGADGSGSAGSSGGTGLSILFDPAGTGTVDASQSLVAHVDTLTRDEAYHLLRRAAFGATPEQVDRAVARGLTATVNDLLAEKEVPGGVTEFADTFEDDVARRWLVYLMESPNPLQERLALFWHDRFAASRRVLSGRDRHLAVLHWEMLRRNALGNYRTFLEELTLDPLMLIWLDGANSPLDAPNENYAREFWELFTLGRDNLYTERDIKEAARAFTGITLLRESEKDARPIFDILNHDETPKSIFPSRAQPANYDYLSVIDLTLAQPEAQRYVVGNLFKSFVHDHPSQAVLDALSADLVAGNYEIAPVVRRILLSQAMFSQDARGNQITSPVEHFIGVARTLDMHAESEDSRDGKFWRLGRDLSEAGMELLDPPGVQGWGEDEAWLEDQWIVSRARALGLAMEFGPDRTSDLPYHLLPDAETWDRREARGEIVDAMAAVFHVDLSEEERDIYIDVLDQNGWRALHLLEPEEQPRHVGEMIRLMAMHEQVFGR